MKHLIYILFLLTIGFTACQQHTAYPPAMQQAEALMNAHPDSALTLLGSMADTLAMLPEETQMYHSLLTIQAKDKLYITHTSDSLINRIVAFYENYGDNDRLMMAYFYQGSTYRDMNDAPRALKAFHQAIDAGKDTKNLTLLGQTYGQMGTLFSYQKLYDEALEATRNALQLYTTQKDSARYPYLNRDIARIYSAKNNNDSALFYYQKAYSLASKFKLELHKIQISNELGCFLYEINQPQKAKKHLLRATEHSSSISNALLYLGHIYQDEQKLDSARICWLMALKYGDIRKKASAYRYLSNLEKSLKNDKQFQIYHQYYQKINDSINNLIKTDTIVKQNLTYKYQKVKKENSQLRNEKRSYKNGLYLLLCILIAVILVYAFTLLTRKRKIDTQKTQEVLFLESDIYHHFRSVSRKEEKDWALLQKELDKTYNGFTQRLKNLYPSISLQEQRICYLIKIKMTNREIANTLYATDSAISMARKRLYKKMTGSEGSGEKLNTLISDL